MKKLSLLILLLVSFSGLAQVNKYNIENFSNLCKAWGVYKYFSQETNIGNIDVDSLLILSLQANKTEVGFDWDAILNVFLNDHLTIKSINNSNPQDYIDSIYNSLGFSISFKNFYANQIKKLLKNRHDSLYYMSYLVPQGSSLPKNERSYSENKYPSFEQRLITVFRYWNWVFYFFPYKHLIDEDWNEVLNESLLSVGNATNSLDYQLNCRAMINRIDDSHSWSGTDLFFEEYAKSQVPFLFTVINDKLIIRRVLGDFYCSEDRIPERGDEILEINYLSFTNIKDFYLKYAPGSNSESKLRNAGAYFKWTQTDTVQIKYISEKDTIQSFIATYNNEKLNEVYQKIMPYDSLLKINKDLIYVDLEKWPRSKIPTLVNKIYNSKGIILDLRTYPEWSMYDLLRYLPHDTTTPTFRFWEPVPNVPGRFQLITVETIPQRKDSLYIGEIITLVNSFTQSRCEFYTMAMQICDNNTTIGSTTSGADGDISCIILPGNIETCFSGIGIEYSDGRQTQRSGVEIEVNLNIIQTDWKEYEDPYLKKAIDWYLSTKK